MLQQGQRATYRARIRFEAALQTVAPGLGRSTAALSPASLSLLQADQSDPVGIYGNGMPFQAMWSAADTRKPELYQQVYDWFPDRTWEHALIIGAGSGTDTAMALANGVKKSKPSRSIRRSPTSAGGCIRTSRTATRA